MGRPKGGKNREWSKEEKLKFVLMVMNGEKTYLEVTREFNLSTSLFWKWMKQYNEGGLEALENKRKPGNPLAKYSRRKELTDIEKLEYELMLYKIEVERLKKGYTEKDVLLALEKLSEKNTK